ncbi:hypothetical protein ACVWWI_006479 [Bradyrhizobium sp. USDA 3686]|nr:hypothetical protein [Bradyrhizobium canariense]
MTRLVRSNPFTSLSQDAAHNLAPAFMGRCEQIDHDPAGFPVRQPLAQAIEGSAIGIAPEQPITVDEVEQCHWLAPQGMDHAPIIDDLIVLAVGMRPPTRQGDEMGAADEHVETIVLKAHPQLVPDQTRRHGVEHLAQGEAAA